MTGTGGLDFLDSFNYGGACGWTLHPGEDWNADGSGQDFGGDKNDAGDPVYAIGNGTIVEAGLPTEISSAAKSDDAGNLILIRHDGSFTLPDGKNISSVWSQYAHLATISNNPATGLPWKADDSVDRGDQLGTVGDFPAGSGGNFHLHLEIRKQPFSSFYLRCELKKENLEPLYVKPSAFINLNRPQLTAPTLDFLQTIQIASFPYPTGLALSPDASKLYVVIANPFSSPRRAIVDVMSTIPPFLVGDVAMLDPGTVEQIASSPDGRRIYVASDNHVEAYDFVEGALRSIPTTSSSLDASDMAVTRDSRKIYVSNRTSNTITMLTMDPNNLFGVVNQVSVGTVSDPYGIALTPDQNQTRLYVVSRSNGRVGVIDTTTTPPTALPSFQASIGASLSTTQIAISSDGRRGYIVDGITNKISIIDTEPGSMTRDSEIAVIQPEQGTKYLDVSVSPSGNSVLVTAANPGKLLLVDVTDPTVFKATRVLASVDIHAPGFIAVGKGSSSGFAFVTSGGGSDPNSQIAIVQVNF